MPPGEYDWTFHVRQRYDVFVLTTLTTCLICQLTSERIDHPVPTLPNHLLLAVLVCSVCRWFCSWRTSAQSAVNAIWWHRSTRCTASTQITSRHITTRRHTEYRQSWRHKVCWSRFHVFVFIYIPDFVECILWKCFHGEHWRSTIGKWRTNFPDIARPVERVTEYSCCSITQVMLLRVLFQKPIWFQKSSWCHCHPISSCCSQIQNGLPFWCWLTQVVLEKGTLNGCSSSSFRSPYIDHHQ